MKYEKPEMEFIIFVSEDVIRTSDLTDVGTKDEGFDF